MEGADAAVHVCVSFPLRCMLADYQQMSEEIDNAATNVPRAIFVTMILNGATGFAMVLAVLFCIDDIDRVVVRSSLLDDPNPILKRLAELTNRLPIHSGVL